MDKIRIRWLLAAGVAVALSTTGLVYTSTQQHTENSAAASGDNPALAAPDGDNPALADFDGDQEAEDEAVVDPNAKGSGPVAFTVPGHATFIDTRTLKSKPTKRPPNKETELRQGGHQGSGPEAPVQSALAAVAAPSATVNVAGLDYANWGAGHPPDTNGVVGPNHFVQTVNTSIGIFNKATGARVSAFTFDAFFANSGTAECDDNNGGDPTLAYDVPSGKWVIADFAWISRNKGPFYECVAVSSGSDPVASTWTFYSVPAGDGNFPDYPKFGSGPDAVYFTTNNFRSNSYAGAGVYALRRSTLGSASLQVQHVTTSSSYFSLLPANTVDAAPAAGPEVIASVWSGKVSLWNFTPNWTTPSATTFTNTANLGVSYSSVGRIPTPGEQVDSLSPRVMNKAQLRNGSLWLSHTVAAGSTSGVRWYEITTPSTAPAIRQQGTFAPTDGQYRWMPSLAVDKQGNMAVGYNVANSTTNPAIRYAGRLATDPLNTLGQSEASLIEGTGAPSNGNYNRWGDYAEMSVDPVDGCTFWFTTEYYATTGANWQTRIGSFKYSGCV
ncbi:hypothetical protein ONA70_15720 [Micromonospora yasonensis]|uniref:hypothetical protein n=1 Tax=Micromonospora yasonensis TaxID=1128667 RepID=UPI00222F6863|nr:hypothetical protein [Micromonospora yasonensis]MCW3841550.1 hypothetical protein [Micromonospora yasonensis]